ncbi:hypothetical protein HYV57_02955 [Candidatus Peregrinibacteria bacterium]|nr:hypothetical protein [Candidatus Peregrinibacteria bacterium]
MEKDITDRDFSTYPFSSHANPFVSTEERDRWQCLFWAEWFLAPMDDEYNQQIPQLHAFIQEGKERWSSLGIDVNTRAEERGLFVEVKTQNRSPDAGVTLMEIQKTLQRQFALSIFDLHISDSITDIWGDVFQLERPEADVLTPRGRRMHTQGILAECNRLERREEKFGRINEWLQGDQHGLSQELWALQSNAISRQRMQIRETLKTLILFLKVNEGLQMVVQSTMPQAHDFTPRLSASSHEPEFLREESDPEEILPSICSTPWDILQHPLLQKALRRTVDTFKEDYDIELLKVLIDDEKNELFFGNLRRMIQGIYKKSVHTADERKKFFLQMENGLKGLMQLVNVAKRNPQSRFEKQHGLSEPLRSMEFKTMSLENLPQICLEYVEVFSQKSETEAQDEEKIQKLFSNHPAKEIPYRGLLIDGQQIKSYEMTPFGIYKVVVGFDEKMYLTHDGNNFVRAEYEGEPVIFIAQVSHKNVPSDSSRFSDANVSEQDILFTEQHGYMRERETGVLTPLDDFYLGNNRKDFFYKLGKFWFKRDGFVFPDSFFVCDRSSFQSCLVYSPKTHKERVFDNYNGHPFTYGNILRFDTHSGGQDIFDSHLNLLEIGGKRVLEVELCEHFGRNVFANVTFSVSEVTDGPAYQVTDGPTYKATDGPTYARHELDKKTLRLVDVKTLHPIRVKLRDGVEEECFLSSNNERSQRYSIVGKSVLYNIVTVTGEKVIADMSNYDRKTSLVSCVGIDGLNEVVPQHIARTSSLECQIVSNALSLEVRNDGKIRDSILVDGDSYDPETQTFTPLTVRNRQGVISFILQKKRVLMRDSVSIAYLIDPKAIHDGRKIKIRKVRIDPGSYCRDFTEKNFLSL